jgi:hypothetical protein
VPGLDRPLAADQGGDVLGLARAASRLVTPSAAIPDSGVPLRQRALQITEDALGLDHPSTALRLSNLAVTYLDLGQADKALPLEERVILLPGARA